MFDPLDNPPPPRPSWMDSDEDWARFVVEREEFLRGVHEATERELRELRAERRRRSWRDAAWTLVFLFALQLAGWYLLGLAGQMLSLVSWLTAQVWFAWLYVHRPLREAREDAERFAKFLREWTKERE